LHEDQIPYFQPAVTVTNSQGTFRPLAGILFTPVIMYFTTGSTWTGVAHGPKVILLIHTQYPFRSNACYFLPEYFRLIVIPEYCYPEAFLG
jgi:hypothetical protein